MGGLLMALRVRGETVDEITGAVTTMRAKMLRVTAPPDAIDVVGTGGDASGSYNISTCAALHRRRRRRAGRQARQPRAVVEVGRRRRARRARRQDRAARRTRSRRCIREAGIGFMFAPAHHPAMKNVGPTRVELGTRTIFNLLGPLSNPAGVKRQMVGVFSRQWIEPMAQVLEESRLRNASGWCTAPTGSTRSPRPARPTSRRWRTARSAPSRSRRRTSASRAPSRRRCSGGDAEHNAAALMAVLKGKQGPVPRRRAAQCRGGADRRRQGQGSEGRRGARGEVARQRRGRRPARPADRGLERRDADDRHPRQRSKPTSARRSRRPSARGRSPRSRRRRRRPPPPRGFLKAIERQDRGRRLRADRRDQEGEPVEGPDPRRLRSAGARAGLRGGRRGLPVGADRRALVPGHAGIPRPRRAPPPRCRRCARISCSSPIRWWNRAPGRRLHPDHHGGGRRRGRAATSKMRRLRYGMDVLVEVHRRRRARARAEAAIAADRHQQPRPQGVQDLARGQRAAGAARARATASIVGESGIYTPADLARLAARRHLDVPGRREPDAAGRCRGRDPRAARPRARAAAAAR